jgi:hypothetical protein
MGKLGLYLIAAVLACFLWLIISDQVPANLEANRRVKHNKDVRFMKGVVDLLAQPMAPPRSFHDTGQLALLSAILSDDDVNYLVQHCDLDAKEIRESREPTLMMIHGMRLFLICKAKGDFPEKAIESAVKRGDRDWLINRQYDPTNGTTGWDWLDVPIGPASEKAKK